MACEECNRLFNQLETALASYKDATRGASGLHGYDLQFHASQERIEKARRRLETCRSALLDHEQHHKDVAPA